MIPTNDEQLAAVLAFDGQSGYDILKAGRILGDEIHILIHAENVDSFQTFLNENAIDGMVMTDNVQEAIEEEAARQRSASNVRVDGRISFSSYQRYNAVSNNS